MRDLDRKAKTMRREEILREKERYEEPTLEEIREANAEYNRIEKRTHTCDDIDWKNFMGGSVEKKICMRCQDEKDFQYKYAKVVRYYKGLKNDC